MSTPNDIDYTRKHDLTIAEVKSCSLFSNLTNKEAQEVIDTLKRFTAIIFESYQSDKKVNKLLNDEQQKSLL